MAQSINFDTGIQEFSVNGNAVLRMNPSDPNLYARLVDLQTKLLDVERELVSKGEKLSALPEIAAAPEAEAAGRQVLALMSEADRKAKALLDEAFGCGNHFDEILQGCNVMAVASNGERVITNFLAQVVPLIEAGVEKVMDQAAGDAVAQAKLNREQRRALQQAQPK